MSDIINQIKRISVMGIENILTNTGGYTLLLSFLVTMFVSIFLIRNVKAMPDGMLRDGISRRVSNIFLTSSTLMGLLSIAIDSEDKLLYLATTIIILIVRETLVVENPGLHMAKREFSDKMNELQKKSEAFIDGRELELLVTMSAIDKESLDKSIRMTTNYIKAQLEGSVLGVIAILIIISFAKIPVVLSLFVVINYVAAFIISSKLSQFALPVAMLMDSGIRGLVPEYSIAESFILFSNKEYIDELAKYLGELDYFYYSGLRFDGMEVKNSPGMIHNLFTEVARASEEMTEDSEDVSLDDYLNGVFDNFKVIMSETRSEMTTDKASSFVEIARRKVKQRKKMFEKEK